MQDSLRFTDIHCHLLPGLDDGSHSWAESCEMARIALSEGVETVVVTPHQLGAFRHVTGDVVRDRTHELQRVLNEHQVPVTVLPGADVRIEPDLLARIHDGSVVTLGDHGRHVLLELPHELYFPLDGVLRSLAAHQLVGILSHPERNQGLLKQRQLVGPLVENGCLMQITAGSVLGDFGAQSQEMSEWMLTAGMVHFVATDAHGSMSRRPLLRRAFERVRELIGEDQARHIFVENPAAVAAGAPITSAPRTKRKSPSSWFRWRKVG